MALIKFDFFSESLGMQTSAYVVMPQTNTNGEIGVNKVKEAKRYKCLYLLHGLSDNQSTWMRRTSIERYAQDYGISVVMPCGDTSFYTDMKYGKKYYTYIAKELPQLINSFFNVSDKREDTYIAGLSMGGYGALKIGLRETGRFCAAAGLSSVADIEHMKHSFSESLVPVFGEELEIPEEENLFSLFELHSGDKIKPRIFMGVGTEDFMYDDNVRLKEHIEALDYDFVYRESKGTHSWAL